LRYNNDTVKVILLNETYRKYWKVALRKRKHNYYVKT